MSFLFKTKYCNEQADIRIAEYAEGVPALMVIDAEDGEHLTTASVNLAGYNEYPAEGNIFIKDWSENEGTLAALVEAGVVSEPVREVKAGFATAYECTLLTNG